MIGLSKSILPETLACCRRSLPRMDCASLTARIRRTVTFQFGPMIMRGICVRFFIVYELVREARERGPGQIKHEIAAHFGLDEIVQAHEALEQGRAIGKVIVTP